VSVAGIILAAGESRRMGYPKALLEYRGQTFLDRLIAVFSSFCDPVIAVLGAHEREIRARVGGSATFVSNPHYARGMLTSLQCGLRAVPAGAEGVLLTLVDHPAVSEETVRAILAPPRPLVRVPRIGDERGHPVWFSLDLIPEFLALSETAAARDVVRAHKAETEFLDVKDPGILSDIDTPEAYRNLIGAGL
jgi:CTP:molybdopterin cytidylyltransferase MocA